MRVLVTGGGGFLGAAAVRALVARGDTAIAFDTQLANLAKAGPEGRLIRVPGDITDMANVAQAVMIHKPDAVLHCAAIVGVLSSLSSPINVVRVNVEGSLNVFEAMRLGAVTLLEKPAEMDLLEREIRNAIGDSREVPAGVSAADAAGLVGEAPALHALLDSLVRVAPSTSTVLLTGESGTGKELVAQAIHRLSRRARGPMVAVNCRSEPMRCFNSRAMGSAKRREASASSA
jgi:transcriptional regulator of aromatic amino acid metabolism